MTTAGSSGPKIVLTGGGTGGHVYPALAVAAAIERLAPGSELLYIGGDRIEAKIVPEAGIPFRSISVHGLAGGAPMGRRLRSLVELAIGLPLIQSLRILRAFRPGVVVGSGGYVSGPVLLAARMMGLPSAALLGDRVPGHTSKIVSRLVDVMAVAHPEMAEFFAARVRKGARVEVTGLPVRREVVALSREEGAGALGLDPARLTLVILGGSLGSRRVNEAAVGALDELAKVDDLAGLQVVHVTGERYAATTEGHRWPSFDCRVLAYAGPEALAAADVVVSRSGASTVAEITARGLAAVLVPWAAASTGEQAMNAEPLERAGGAVVIGDGELTAERLADVLAEILTDAARLKRMADASKALGRPKAAERVAEIALELAAKGRV